MNGFLDELERELVAAYPRRARARRRALAGRASLALVLVAVVGVAGVFLLSVGREGPGGSASRPPAEAPGPAPAPLPETAPTRPGQPMPALPPDSIAVVDGTDRHGVAVGVTRVIGARYDVGLVRGVPQRRDATRTVVFHEPAFRRAAELVAMDLGASLAPMDATAREAGAGAEIVVEIGRDIRRAGVAPVLRRDGTAAGDLAALRFDDRTVVALNPQLTPGRYYAVWARRTSARPKFLGFIPEVRSKRRFVVTFSVPASVRARSLFITTQRATRTPRSPGRAILTADLPR